ncbi:DMT family transporter [Parvibaculaceae bacterium PLY_AMNH_Bact1]|nr:DMT family transporter [Parvibaculaceae bacterium PLY_AMNH_Bact1]
MSLRKHTSADYRDLALLAVLWSGAFALTDLAVATMTPAWSVAIRMLVSAAVLAPFMVVNREPIPRTRKMWGWLTALALCGDLIPFFLLSWGITLIASGLSAILVGVMPLITLVLARVFVPGETLTATRISGFVIGLIGLIIVVGPNTLDGASAAGTPLLGEMLVLAAAFFFAMNAIIARRAPPAPLYSKACLTTGLAGVIMLPLAWAEAPLNMDAITVQSWIAVIVLGALPVGYATIVYFRVIESAGPSFMAMTNYLVPVLALAIGAVFLDETITLHAMIGLAVILGGIGLAELRR